MGLSSANIVAASCVLVFGLSLSLAQIKRSKYGESCGSQKRCDMDASLTCRNATCECYKPDIMYYDPILESCLVLVGAKCRYPISSEDNTNQLGNWIPPSRRNLQEELDCVQNAWCNPSGVCMCTGDYLELGNGTCITKRNFEESCTSDSECRQDRFLSCIENRCGCNETTSSYNLLLRQCVGKAGSPCLGLDGCVYNAECTTLTQSSTSRRRARQNGRASTCSCISGFVSDSSGFCKVGLGGQCSDSRPCSSRFKCANGKCTCPFPNLQVAMKRTQACISLVGGPCNENDSDSTTNTTQNYQYQCVDNASCFPNNDTGFYECRCNDGFTENTGGTCDLAFGSRCDVKPLSTLGQTQDDYLNGALWKKPVQCDTMTPLFCVDGICQCQSSLYYFDGTGTCLGKHGAKCKTSCVSSSDCQQRCIDGASCVGSRGMETQYGRCRCSEGYSVIGNRTCVKSK